MTVDKRFYRDERYGRSVRFKDFKNPSYFTTANVQASFIDLKFDEDRVLVVEYQAVMQAAGAVDLSVPFSLPYGEVQLFYFDGNSEVTLTLPLYDWLARRTIVTRRLRAIVYLFVQGTQPANQDMVVYCGASESHGQVNDYSRYESRVTLTAAPLQPTLAGRIKQIQLLTGAANALPTWLQLFGFSPAAGNHPYFVVGEGNTSMNPIKVDISTNFWTWWVLSTTPDVYTPPNPVAPSVATVPLSIELWQ